MAIIIEDENKKKTSTESSLVAFGWVVIIVILLVAGYYLFFAAPPVAVVPAPVALTQLQPLSQISVSPQDVTAMPAFKALHNSIPTLSTTTVSTGRQNPFIAP